MLDKLNRKETCIVFGRANSGTRILPEAMRRAGIFMGEPLNYASDLLPAEDIYEACRIFGGYVDYKGKYEWDFSRALEAEIPDDFVIRLENYLKSIIKSDSEKIGWKIPENTLIYPWLTRLLPNATFLYWVRRPETTIVKMSHVDRLEKWNIPCKKFLFHEWNYKMRAVSWKYHHDIVAHTPTPKHFLMTRFEDYILDHERTRKVVEEKIGLPLSSIDLNPEKTKSPGKNYAKRFPFLKKALQDLAYNSEPKTQN